MSRSPEKIKPVEHLQVVMPHLELRLRYIVPWLYPMSQDILKKENIKEALRKPRKLFVAQETRRQDHRSVRTRSYCLYNLYGLWESSFHLYINDTAETAQDRNDFFFDASLTAITMTRVAKLKPVGTDSSRRLLAS